MTRETFQQLVCDWLDERGDAGRRAAIDAALRADPSLAAELVALERLHALLAETPAALRRVDFARLRGCVAQAIDQPAADGEQRLDDLLRAAATPALPVDWDRLAGRISAAVRASDAAAQRGRLKRFGLPALGITAAAAAVLAFAFLWPRTLDPSGARPPAEAPLVVWNDPAGHVRVQVAGLRGGGGAQAEARLVLAAEPVEDPGDDVDAPATAVAEVFFMIDPIAPRPAGVAPALLGVY